MADGNHQAAKWGRMGITKDFVFRGKLNGYIYIYICEWRIAINVGFLMIIGYFDWDVILGIWVCKQSRKSWFMVI